MPCVRSCVGFGHSMSRPYAELDCYVPYVGMRVELSFRDLVEFRGRNSLRGVVL